MNVPTFSYDKVVDKDGNWSFIWLQIVTQLLQQLQLNFSNEGCVVPEVSAADIVIIAANLPANGTMLYDSTNDLLKVWVGGTGGSFKTVTVT